MDAGMVTRWLERYQEAWRTDERALIEELFTEDAVYVTGPWDEPWTGLDRIVEGWMEHSDSGADWDFRYEIVALGEKVAVIQGWTSYRGQNGGPGEEYSNIWLLWFTPEGKAHEFREWWVVKPS